MTNLLEIREWLRNFYGRFSLYVNAGAKFFTMLVTALLINGGVGFNPSFKSPVVALLMAMTCAFLPGNVMALFAAGLVLIHLYKVSLELALIVLIIFLIVLLTYYRFTPRYAYALLLTAIALALKVPLLVPLVLGMVATPVTMVPVCLGGFVFFLLQNVSTGSMNVVMTEEESAIQAYLYVIENTIKSPQTYLVIGALALTVLVVYLIRRMSVDHSWKIAIVSGTTFYLLVLLIGDFFFDVSGNVLEVVLGSLVSMLLAFLLQFFLFSVDYTRTEHVQFEDDEYYYYVKAVPKLTIAKREKEVKRINPQRKERVDRRRG